MKTGVYQIKNSTNGRRYIGSAASNIEQRWREHRSLLNRGMHNLKLQNAWNKYGEACFIFEVLEECEASLCVEREQHYLNMLLFADENDRRFDELGYNALRIAGSALGFRHSEETKQKMSAIRIGRPHPCSKETRQKIAAANRGKRRSQVEVERMSLVQKGERNSNVKLTARDVAVIKRAIGFGVKQNKIAARFSVSKQLVSAIKTGTVWRNDG